MPYNSPVHRGLQTLKTSPAALTVLLELGVPQHAGPVLNHAALNYNNRSVHTNTYKAVHRG